MSPNPVWLQAFLAGSALSFAVPAHAAEPPRITTVTQTAVSLEAGGSSRLGVQALDPQGSPLTFSWSATAGSLTSPLGNATTSRLYWTAPTCLAEGSAPVMATVTNGHGLSATASFDFSVARDLSVDHQPPFTSWGFEQTEGVGFYSPSMIEAEDLRVHIPAERIRLDVDQRVSVTYVSEGSHASSALGFLYYDDLLRLGYLDVHDTYEDSSDDTLADRNGNGIADLHEDLYNLAPRTGLQARRYIGAVPRCPAQFTSGGFTYSQPELALNANCTPAFQSSARLEDARPGLHPLIDVDVVGSNAPQTPGQGYSDRGLFARIPNLLEPAHELNRFQGLGHLAFLLADDDADRSTFQQLGAVSDVSAASDGIPDYDVSAYDSSGAPRAVNPDPGISALDRTVDLGVIQGGRELVFFLVVVQEEEHDPASNRAYPCLRKQASGRCALHLKTPVSVFFSKAKWNLDQDPLGRTPVAHRNIGCTYQEACQSPSSPSACTVAGTNQKLCGWLDPVTLARLDTPAYGNIVLPQDAESVAPSGNGNMPHLMMRTVGPNQGRWLMGFEDSNGGGDRDFNDVVFRVNTEGRFSYLRSKVLSVADPACAISRVRFRKVDSMGPGCDDSASFAYAVATDCQVCDGTHCSFNPKPTWHPVTAPGTQETIIDVSSSPGHQVCWEARLKTGWFDCRLRIHEVDVGFEAAPVE
ncbi:DUF4114 domain-containing protein [Corallococcus terminator]|uniref:DUF4114 domain-containing protein n=1 Tax=Corallococcus terminator TaxID=2316733 RepID=A0A3A8JCF3_9BACT|nr:DUF4114 domain-containing protein [Corallococcus terminator]RKG92738.1 DUF4114 domain-containing protein [Corallococcus terminator]